MSLAADLLSEKETQIGELNAEAERQKQKTCLYHALHSKTSRCPPRLSKCRHRQSHKTVRSSNSGYTSLGTRKVLLDSVSTVHILRAHDRSLVSERLFKPDDCEADNQWMVVMPCYNS